MIEKVEEAIELLTIGYNIANEYFTVDDSNAGYKIGYIEGVIAAAIRALNEVVDDERSILN